MISWQNPGWLWGLAALAVPLVIHLLNASSGQPLTFPALRFTAPSRARRVRSVALRQPWLLALRWLLLTLLVLWLAGPTWRPAVPAATAGPVLVSPLALQRYPEAARAKALELMGAGAEAPRQLATGFPDLDQPAVYEGPVDQMLRSLADTWPERTQVVTVADSLDRSWLAEPLPAGVTLHTVADGALPPLEVGLLAGTERSEDARYVRAALTALASADLVRWRELTSTVASGPDSKVLDALVSLGVDPSEVDVAHRFYLTDAAGTGDRSELTVGEQRFTVQRAANLPVGEPVLRDDDGVPLLVLSNSGQVPGLTFAGRFHPDTNSLVSSAAFVDLLSEWLLLARQLPQPLALAENPAPSWWLAALLLVSWLLERALALRASPTAIGATPRRGAEATAQNTPAAAT
ncbi:MAG: BatA domain-containing protein [Pseudomonadota bacterium]